MALLTDDELCKYFNQMIIKLVVYKISDYSYIVFSPSDKVWKIFSNLEQLECEISQLKDLVELFIRLPKLANLSVKTQ